MNMVQVYIKGQEDKELSSFFPLLSGTHQKYWYGCIL